MAAGESYWPALAMTAVVAAAYVWLMTRRFERSLG